MNELDQQLQRAIDFDDYLDDRQLERLNDALEALCGEEQVCGV